MERSIDDFRSNINSMCLYVGGVYKIDSKIIYQKWTMNKVKEEFLFHQMQYSDHIKMIASIHGIDVRSEEEKKREEKEKALKEKEEVKKSLIQGNPNKPNLDFLKSLQKRVV